VYKHLAKPLLFKLDAERAHHLIFDNLKRAARIPGTTAVLRSLYNYQHPSLERELFGLKFPNPVGLAAGFDKNAVLTDELAALAIRSRACSDCPPTKRSLTAWALTTTVRRL
jgi:dihydroorotate dehydrogenase